MKTFITTTDLLGTVDVQTLKTVDNLFVLVKDKDAIPVTICETLFGVCSTAGFTVTFGHYIAKEDMFFQLGCVLNKDDEYIMSDGILKIPEYMMKDYKITIAKGKKVVTKSKPKKAPKQAIVNKDELDDNKKEDVQTASKDMLVPPEPVDIPDVVTVHPPSTDDTKSLIATVASASKSTPKKKPVPVPVSMVKTEQNVSTGIVTNDAATNSQEYNHADAVIKEFLKRSGIRVADMQYVGTDEALADEILDILEPNADKDRIQNELQMAYGFDDSQYIMKWIGPNIPKLHEIAVQRGE